MENEKLEPSQANTSPVPNQPTPMPNHPTDTEDYPVCKCGQKLDEVRYLDYADMRVVYHTGKGCIIGVMKAE